MTDNFNENAAENNNGKGRRPTHVAKVRHGHGKGATFEQIGVGWVKENGKNGIYVKFYGKQIVENFTLYELPQSQDSTQEANY